MPREELGGFRFLEHTSDAYIEAWGPTLEAAFANAAAGLYEIMFNLESVEPTTQGKVHVEGHDEQELLYNWLEALLLKFDIDKLVYSRFDIDHIVKKPKSMDLNAKVKGEKYDREKHGAKVEVKGVTYHRMEILKQSRMVTVRFILDL